MLKVGLTGGIASGKSFVGEALAGYGCLLIHADELGHAALEPGGEAYEPVVQEFGREILTSDGAIDRRALAARAFADPQRLARLNALVHAAVIRPVRNAGRMWSEPATAESAGFSTDEQNNIDIYKSARDATVFITSVVYTRSFFGVYPEKGTGTGFVISPEGEILTNNHVAGGSAQLTVTLSDKKVYKARVLGYDPRNDLALIKIDAGRKLPTIRLGDSDRLVVGQKVLAIGNPFQFEGTLTTGIVSSLDRTIAVSYTHLTLPTILRV